MGRTSLVIFLALSLMLDSGVAMITNWTTPVIASQSGRATIKVREDLNTFSTIMTLRASSRYSVTYSLDTWFTPFLLYSDGRLTLLSALDYEEDKSHVIRVKAVDGAYSTGTATLTIQVQNVDEPPEFKSSSFSPCILEGSSGGTMVEDASATDPEGQEVTHALIGHTEGVFTIDSRTGMITIRDGNTVDNTTSSYDFSVRATDGLLYDTASVSVTVADDCSQASSLPVEFLTILLPIFAMMYSQTL